MKIHLDSLTVRYKGSEHDVINQCKKLFMENYIRDSEGAERKIYTHDGLRVHFVENDFAHAFYEDKDKKIFSFDRARRVRWIGAIISGQVSGVVVRLAQDHPRRGITRRLYMHIAKKYLVILTLLNNGEFRFCTHYSPRQENVRTINQKTNFMELI